MSHDPQNPHPTVAPQAEIDRIASGLAGIWFAEGWISQPQNPNYHEDYVIECVPNGELSGLKFSVQQKAHRHVAFSQGLASEVMATKHLIYYSEKVRTPIFLLVVDVTTRLGYYLFLQEWLNHKITPETLRDQDSLTVKVPESNRIDDTDRFRKEIGRAFDYMDRKYPGSVADAIAHDEKQVMAVDPRWDVKLNVVDSQKQYFLSAKEKIEASMRVSGSNAEKMKEAFEYGIPAELKGAGITLQGSPLFEKWTQEGGIASFSVKPAKPVNAEIEFWTDDEASFRLTLRGALTGGRIGLAFTCQLEGGPLFVQIKIPREAIKQRSGETFVTFRWDFSPWEGKPLLRLPHFSELRRFAQAVFENKPIHFRPMAEGEKLSAGKIEHPQAIDVLASAAWMIETMARARELSDKCGIVILFPRLDQVPPDDYERLAIAYGVLIEGEFRMPGAGARLNMKMNRKEHDPAELVAQYEKYARDGFAINRPSETLSVFGTAIELGPVLYSVAPTIGIFAEPGRSDFLAGRAMQITVEFRGTEDSTFRVAPWES
jgi:hypothetical protein